MKERKPLPPERHETWLRNSALHLLAQRISSEENLRRILVRRARRRIPEAEDVYLAELVVRVIGFCRDQGLVNDTAYAETKAAVAARRGVSRRTLSQQLRSKGVDAPVVADAVAELDDARSAVRFARRRRLGPWRSNSSEQTVMKDVAAFGRGGFSTEIAFRMARMPLDQAETLLYGDAADGE